MEGSLQQLVTTFESAKTRAGNFGNFWVQPKGELQVIPMD